MFHLRFRWLPCSYEGYSRDRVGEKADVGLVDCEIQLGLKFKHWCHHSQLCGVGGGSLIPESLPTGVLQRRPKIAMATGLTHLPHGPQEDRKGTISWNPGALQRDEARV